jgi:hypothetical protein
MKLYNLNTKDGFVNLFADTILKEFGFDDSNTIIEVINLDNFIIIKGITDSKKVVDVHEFKLKFLEDNKEYLDTIGIKHINTIELIEYKESVDPIDSLWFKYYNSDRPVYSDKQISSLDECLNFSNQTEFLEFSSNENTLSNFTTLNNFHQSSSFPFGYSLSMGRLLMYYGEMIYYNTKSSFQTNCVAFKLTTNKTIDDFDIQFSGSTSQSKSNEKMKSAILDLFDFDLNSFYSKFSDYDMIDDIKKQLGPKPWLTKILDPNEIILF